MAYITKKIHLVTSLLVFGLIAIFYIANNRNMIRFVTNEEASECDCGRSTLAATTKPTTPVFNEFATLLKQASYEQALIPKPILMRTMRYMIEERGEYDEELVAFVASLIVPPPADRPSRPRVGGTPNSTDFSQFGQSIYMDSLLGGMRNGYFVESGGLDGELYSNSLFFELARGWTGKHHRLNKDVKMLHFNTLNKKRSSY